MPRKNHRKHRRLVGLGGFILAIALTTLALSQKTVRLNLQTLLQQPVTVETVRQATDTLGVDVYLEGQVGNRVPLVNAMVYQLRDATGTIWVVTPDTTVQPGQTVRIRGTIRFESIPVAGQELGEIYLEEQHRQWLD